MNILHLFHRLAVQAAGLLVAIGFASVCIAAPTAPPEARAELAPTGKLRVGLLVGNPVFVTKDGPAEEMRGVAVDLSRELAKQLGVPIEPVRYGSIAKMIDGAKAGEWDVAFLGFSKERLAYMDYTAAYLEQGSTYLVPAGSNINTVGDADKSGYRIGVAERSVQDGYLTRNLKQAQLVRFANTRADGPRVLTSGEVHALAGTRLILLAVAETIPGSRVLEDNFTKGRNHLAVNKGRPAGTAYAKKFIEHAKASGLVQQAIAQAQLRGVNVAALDPGM